MENNNNDNDNKNGLKSEGGGEKEEAKAANEKTNEKIVTFRSRRNKNKNMLKRNREEENKEEEEEEEKVEIQEIKKKKIQSALKYTTKDAQSKIEVGVKYESSGTAVPQDLGVTSVNEIDAVNIKKTSFYGPMKASANIRVTCRFDYQPDICKDYKETGFCGYGDNCKFMHDRGDYKSSVQIDKEWEERQKNLNSEENYEIKEEDDNKCCFICRDDFTEPIVVTKCGHYFCEKCALKRVTKTKLCAVCKENTYGSFSIVKNFPF